MSDLRVLAEQIANRVKSKTDEYIVKLSLVKDLMVKYARGEISVTQSWKTLRLELYVAKNGRIAVSSFESENPENLVEKACSVLDFLKPSPFYAPLPEPSGEPLSYVDRNIVDIVESGDASKQVEEINAAEAGDVAGKVEFGHTATTLLGSNGADLYYEATSFNGYLRVFRGESSGQWSWTSTSYDPSLARRAIDTASHLADTCSKLPKKQVKPGKYRVLLSPMVAANLVEHIVSAASAGSIVFGISFFAGKKPGEKVLSEKLTILDKPRDTSLPFFRGFDDEGVATHDKPVIENGILKTLLHNSKTAKVMNAKTTGNAGWIMPHPFNIEVLPGDNSLDELVEQLRDGIYITNNWYTRFQNHVEGVFSTVSRDAVIVYEGGKPAYCTERIRIADKMPRLFSSVEALGKELWQIEWWEVSHPTRIPHILLSEANISLPR
ncbi:TldD/PmbA family protein [Pyrofollis japonicus]|uniref:TldD/PmbA family protein n=1 Tax=Pyrofollis japonicus TaxID=3060460 RepID=UPI00295BF549|nr:TldD/PmbA family protein [Pyrofollis japonicus]BEP18550.1 TldD/PmbA family protein [Pyrofollis japonicus]